MKQDRIQQLQRLDQKHLLHPFTNHADLHAQGTTLIERAEGCFVFDEQGRKLLDGLAGLWCVNVGYGRKEIIDAVRRQMESVVYYPSFFNTTTESSIILAEKLATLAPKNLNHTIFTNSGSEANETAMKIIRSVQKIRGASGKTKLLSRQYAYHGVGIATTSLTGLPNCQQPFDLPLPGFLHAPAPYPYGANSSLSEEEYGKKCLEETARFIEKEDPKTIAAFFVEPIQGAGGVIIPPVSYLKGLRKLCREQGILFVADEVITGFGRLGSWFASNLWDLDPDLMCLAKGISSGYLPLGAVMMSDQIADDLITHGYFAHGFTYSGHPTATAAGLANVELIEREGLIPNVESKLSPYFLAKLQALKNHRAVGQVRGFGLIAAIEMLPKEGRAGLNPLAPLGLKGAKLARQEGVIVRGIRDLIAVAPPLVISTGEIDLLFSGVQKALDRLWD